MHSTTSFVLLVIATTLGFLFTRMSKAFPTTDEDRRTSTLTPTETNGGNRLNEETHIYDEITGKVQFDSRIEHQFKETLNDTPRGPVLQKCKRNKRHVHRQVSPDNHKNSINIPTEEGFSPDASTAPPLTDAEILDIELKYQIERVKRKILDKLHLDQPPKLTAPKPQLPLELSRKLVPVSAQTSSLLTNASAVNDIAEDDDEENVADDAGKTTQIIVIAENGE